MVNNKVVFNFKSNWFDGDVVKKIGIDGLWVYFNIRKYKLQYSKDACIFSLDLLHKEIQHYYKSNNRKFSKVYIKEVIFNLKKHSIVEFDRKYNMLNSKDLCCCELLDLPNLDDKFKPISNDDYFITVDTDTINKIFEVGLNERHIISYYVLKKYINVQGTASGHITLSYQKMGEWIGINKDTANGYCVELENKKILANEYTKSQAGHKSNSFILTTNKNIGDDATVNEISDKNGAKRLKRKLQNNKIKVTERAFDKYEEELKLMTNDEKIKFNKLKEKNVVYAIEYIYFELLEGLKQRKKDQSIFLSSITERNNTKEQLNELYPEHKGYCGDNEEVRKLIETPYKDRPDIFDVPEDNSFNCWGSSDEYEHISSYGKNPF